MRARNAVVAAFLFAALGAGCPPADRGAPGPAPSPHGGGGDSAVPPNALELCIRADRKLLEGDPQGALSDLEGAVQLDPRFHRIYHLRGVALKRLGRVEEAMQDFVQVLALDPTYADPGFLEEAGETLVARGHAQTALNILGRAAQLTPALLLVSAKAKEKLGDFAGAKRDLEKVLELAPDLAGAVEFRAALEQNVSERESHYTPAENAGLLAVETLALEGLARLTLPRDFAPSASAKGAKARRKGAEAALVLQKEEDAGADLDAVLADLRKAAESKGLLVKTARSTEWKGRKGLFLHLVEPGPESGMFDPFNIVRYRWIFDAPGGAVGVVLEAEVDRGADDLPDGLRRDLLAAMATLAFE